MAFYNNFNIKKSLMSAVLIFSFFMPSTSLESPTPLNKLFQYPPQISSPQRTKKELAEFLRNIPGSFEPLTKYDFNQKPISDKKQDSLIEKHARTSKIINKGLIKKIIFAESSWNPVAEGKAGERGLMQLMPKAWETANPRKNKDYIFAYDPGTNIESGTLYLLWLEKTLSKKHPLWTSLKDSEKEKLILASYNWGPTNIIESNFKITEIPKETQDYIGKIQ